MIQRFLHLYWRFARGMTLGVRGVVLDADGRVFLVRHGYTPGWYFPGGGVEPGESLVEALARELLEEGNLRITGTPPLHGVFRNAHSSPRDHVAVFVAREFEWRSPPPPSWEIAEAGFFPLNKLPEGTSEGTRRRLEEILYGAPVNASW
jgi:8-oxo-dGTP pyrophosphatase MutT (NUDIX family)